MKRAEVIPPKTHEGEKLLEELRGVPNEMCAHHYGNLTYDCSCESTWAWMIRCVEAEARGEETPQH